MVFLLLGHPKYLTQIVRQNFEGTRGRLHSPDWACRGFNSLPGHHFTYIRPDSSTPYREWFDSLDAQAAAKVAAAKIRMELGNTSNVKWFSGIGEYVVPLH